MPLPKPGVGSSNLLGHTSLFILRAAFFSIWLFYGRPLLGFGFDPNIGELMPEKITDGVYFN